MCDNTSEAALVEDRHRSVDEEVADGKNRHLVKCQFCPSNILNPGLGVYDRTEFDLPAMTKRKAQEENSSSSDERYEQLVHFWRVPNMYTFENIGFSNTIGSIKYLACADCEIGPIGYYDTNSKISYVALARVCHVS